MPNEIQKILEKYNITPNKVLGQNFLLDEGSVKELVEAAEITKEDTVIEVGPGTGVITKELAKRASQVIAVEKDPNMVKILEDELKNYENITVVNEDILKFKMTNDKIQMPNEAQNLKSTTKLVSKTYNLKYSPYKYKLVGAPPYYLTARLFREFLEQAEFKPSIIAVIIQKEVAEKICAQPPDMNLLSISVQLYGKPKIAGKIPKNSFWPEPKIDSAILLVENIKKPDIDEVKFFKLVRAGFWSPRKQLLGNLSRNLNIERPEAEKVLKKCGISPKQRAETLSITDWKNITKNL